MPFAVPSQPAANPSQLPLVDYEKSLQDPTAAPEKQAKIALDSAISSGNMEQLQVVLTQIGQHVPQQTIPLMMHALRTAARQGNLGMVQFLLGQVGGCTSEQLAELLKYALDGAASQENPVVMDFLLGRVQEAFVASNPACLIQLVQRAVNEVAKQGNIVLLKFLMDRTAAASIGINYDVVFRYAAANGKVETLLKQAIIEGAQYENVILMLLQSAQNLPDNNDSCLGSRQSIKTTAKVQLVKSYKRKNPELFVKLMTAVKSFFPEDIAVREDDIDM